MGNAFRNEEKEKGWNNVLYQELKKARNNFSNAYKSIADLETVIHQHSTRLYRLNKIIYHKRDDSIKSNIDSDTIILRLRLKNALESNKLGINRVDPGIHSTALASYSSVTSNITSVNRPNGLNGISGTDDIPLEDDIKTSILDITPKFLSTVCLSQTHSRKREARKSNTATTTSKQLQKDRLTR